MAKIAIKSNDNEVSIKVIEKLEKEGYIIKGKMKPHHLNYMYYIPDKDIIVSPLYLDMYYPDYKAVYGSEYLKIINTKQ